MNYFSNTNVLRDMDILWAKTDVLPKRNSKNKLTSVRLAMGQGLVHFALHLR